jgi:hypothetical protein
MNHQGEGLCGDREDADSNRNSRRLAVAIEKRACAPRGVCAAARVSR